MGASPIVQTVPLALVANELFVEPAKEAQEEARNAAAETRRTQEAQIADAKKRQEDADARTAQEATSAASRRRKAPQSGNRSGTLLTSPLGLVGMSNTTGGKTLLGQ